MLITKPFYKEFIQMLNKHEVQYILVGGAAVHSHGYDRYTGDVDIWVNPEESNMTKLFAAIDEYGFSIEKIVGHQFTDKDSPIKLMHEGDRIDIIHHLTNVITFDEAWSKVTKEKKDETEFNLINYHHLISIKKAAGRLKDLADVEELQRYHAVKEGKPLPPRKKSFLQKLLEIFKK